MLSDHSIIPSIPFRPTLPFHFTSAHLQDFLHPWPTLQHDRPAHQTLLRLLRELHFLSLFTHLTSFHPLSQTSSHHICLFKTRQHLVTLRSLSVTCALHPRLCQRIEPSHPSPDLTISSISTKAHPKSPRHRVCCRSTFLHSSHLQVEPSIGVSSES